MSKRMTAYRRRRIAMIDDMIDICRARGLSSAHLHKHVVEVTTYGSTKGDGHYDPAERLAISKTAEGLTSQINTLMIAWGEKKLRSVLSKSGGILDAIVLHTGTTAEELESDAGRGALDSCGRII